MGQADLHTPIQQAGVQQVQICAVLLDVADHLAHFGLLHFLRVVVHILHVALVHPENAEAYIHFLVRMFGLNFIPRPPDALFADLTDILVSRLIGLTLFITGFRQLHHDKLAVPAVLSIELHHRMGCGGRARKEVQNNRILPTISNC